MPLTWSQRPIRRRRCDLALGCGAHSGRSGRRWDLVWYAVDQHMINGGQIEAATSYLADTWVSGSTSAPCCHHVDGPDGRCRNSVIATGLHDGTARRRRKVQQRYVTARDPSHHLLRMPV